MSSRCKRFVCELCCRACRLFTLPTGWRASERWMWGQTLPSRCVLWVLWLLWGETCTAWALLNQRLQEATYTLPVAVGQPFIHFLPRIPLGVTWGMEPIPDSSFWQGYTLDNGQLNALEQAVKVKNCEKWNRKHLISQKCSRQFTISLTYCNVSCVFIAYDWEIVHVVIDRQGEVCFCHCLYNIHPLAPLHWQYYSFACNM